MVRAPDDLTTADALAREVGRSTFDVPVVLEAGAGTGKTAVLVARVLTWVLGPGWHKAERRLGALGSEGVAAVVLSRVAAITFTDRAANEMAERVASGLMALHRGDDVIGLPRAAFGISDEKIAERCAALLAHRDRLTATTIHAFCRRILAQYPIEANLHPRFEVDADGAGGEELVEELVTEQLFRCYGGGSSANAHVELAVQGVGPAEIADALLTFAHAGLSPASLEADAFTESRVAEAVDELTTSIEGLLKVLVGLRRAKRGARLGKANEALAMLQLLAQELVGCVDAEQLAEALSRLASDSLMDRLKLWGRGRFSKTELSCFDDLAEEVSSASLVVQKLLQHLGSLRPSFTRQGLSVLAPLYRQLSERMRSQGVTPFAALLPATLDLLSRHPEVAKTVSEGIDQLMVDEFQDTDPRQCALVQLLALGPSTRPGLMVVGDPKQSIYGWREADLAAYEAFVQQVLGEGGQLCRLSVNFRSTDSILQEVSRLMEPSMLAIPGVQPEYQPLVAGAAPEAPDWGAERGAVEHWISWAGPTESKHGPDTLASRAREIEARAIANDLWELHQNHGLQWGEVALLMRATTYQDEYLQPLKERGIPYVVERDRSYYRRREVIDIAACVRAIFDPADQLAMVSFLRSVSVGVPDQMLLPLWQGGFPGLTVELGGDSDDRTLSAIDDVINGATCAADLELPCGYPAGWQYNLKLAMRAVARLRRDLERLPADELLEELRDAVLPEASEASRYLGAHRLANLQRFFSDLASALASDGVGGKGVGLTALLRALRRCVQEGSPEEEAPVGDESLDAVRVLTIHKAKGLTFDHVYLAGLGSSSRGRTLAMDDAVEREGRWEGRLFGASTLGYDRVLARRQAVERAELVRTLYVGITRPRHRLVLAGRWSEGVDATVHARCHADLLQRRQGAEQWLRELWTRAGVLDVNILRDDGCHDVLFRLLGSPKEQGRPRSSRESWAPSIPADVEASAHDAQLRLAQARQVRPFALAPSTVEDPPAITPATVEARGEQLGLFSQEPKENDVADQEVRRDVSRLAGTAVHRALEEFDLGASNPRSEAERQRNALGRYLASELAAMEGSARISASTRTRAQLTAEEIFDAFVLSTLFERFSALADRVIGREVPMLAAPEAGIMVAEPTGVVIGSIDLLYQDEQGRVCVVDFKTNRVNSQGARGLASHYMLQGRAYARAVQAALALDYLPVFELWFLTPGLIVVPPLVEVG